MIVTIDTNIVINACKNLSWDHLDVLSLIRTQSHVVALDIESSGQSKILAEYRGNCSGIELYENGIRRYGSEFSRCRGG